MAFESGLAHSHPDSTEDIRGVEAGVDLQRGSSGMHNLSWALSLGVACGT